MTDSLSAHLFDDAHFDEKAFVERIAASSGSAKPSKDDFNPGPLIAAFTSALTQLKRVEDDVGNGIGRLLAECDDAEQDHRSKVAELQEGLKETFRGYRRLNERISNVGTTAVRIGDRLENVDLQRSRAEEASSLLLHYGQFCRGEEHLSAVFTSGEHVEEAALLIQKLYRFATDLDVAGNEDTLELIEEYRNSLENRLLDRFERAQGQVDVMAECARILMGFNDGRGVFRRYVASRPMFMDRRVIERDHRMIESYSRRRSREPHGPHMQIEILTLLYRNVSETCRVEYDMVKDVFPNAELVMAMLIERIFQQRIQAHLEGVLTMDDDSVTTEWHLDALVAVHVQTRELALELQQYTGSEMDVVRAAEDLVASQKRMYVGLEAKALENVLTAAMERAGPPVAEIRSDVNGKQYDASQGVHMDASVVTDMVRANALALKRCGKLHPDADRAQVAVKVFLLLLDKVSAYLGQVLDRAVAAVRVDEEDARARRPAVRFYGLVARVTDCFVELEDHFQSNLLPSTSTAIHVYSQCAKARKEVLQQLENRIRDGLALALAKTMDRAAHVLDHEQNKTDFRPRDDAPPSIGDCTSACRLLVDFLQTETGEIKRHLDARNLDALLAAFCSRLHALILRHVTRFVFTEVGGFMLMRDMSEYYNLAAALPPQSEWEEKFAVLRELPNIYLCAPENLPDFIQGSRLASLPALLTAKLVSLRADFKQAKIAKILHLRAEDVEAATHHDSSVTRLARHAIGRHSAEKRG